MGARSQPLLFCITTNGFVRGGIFDAQYEYAKKVIYGDTDNKRFLPFIYELDDHKEWDKEECWEKANPGLGTIKSVDYLRQMVDKAKSDAAFKPTVMVKDFNIPQTSETAWLRYEELNNETMIPADAVFKYCIGGIDAADSIDLAAAKAICMRPNDEHIYISNLCTGFRSQPLTNITTTGTAEGVTLYRMTYGFSKGICGLLPTARLIKRCFLTGFWNCEKRKAYIRCISVMTRGIWTIVCCAVLEIISVKMR